MTLQRTHLWILHNPRVLDTKQSELNYGHYLMSHSVIPDYYYISLIFRILTSDITRL